MGGCVALTIRYNRSYSTGNWLTKFIVAPDETMGGCRVAMSRICSMQVTGVGQVNVWLNSHDHCDPHVHCGDRGRTWEGQIKFSFLSNVPTFWNCLTPANDPGIAVFTEILQILVSYLRQCRAEWWRFHANTIGCCLTNSTYDDVAGRQRLIGIAVYDAATNSTELTFTNGHKRKVCL